MILQTKYKMKPPIGTTLVRGHPLADALVACWLFNEAAGNKVTDLSGNANDGTVAGALWRPSKNGVVLSFDEADDYLSVPDSPQIDLPDGDWSIWLRYCLADNSGSAYQYILSWGAFGATPSINLFIYEDGIADAGSWKIDSKDNDGTAKSVVSASQWPADSKWHLLGVQRDASAGEIQLWMDGVKDNFESDAGFNGINRSDALNIGRRVDGNADRYFGGLVSQALKYDRALSDYEIAWLYREPFAMFGGRGRAELLGAPTSQVVTVTGASSAQSSVSGRLSIVDRSQPIQTAKAWLTDALFAGMTANAFKLGTAISLGWFWMRVGGCSALYRGPRISRIDWSNILSVANVDADSISPPCWLPHAGGAACFYAVRRFNRCGVREHTLAAAVRVSFDAEGNLSPRRPNGIFSAAAEAADGGNVRLKWFYSPLAQQVPPVRFNVYHDSRSGQIDYDNPIGTVEYRGRRFYGCTCGPLEAGRYLFAVRAGDANGTQDHCSAMLSVETPGKDPDAVDVLKIEAV
ncbi:MAG: LamG domain-containing protein [Sedimentisphaerales bacterium]|nr:LamG domain-containing protein [Sedimentisphaerales bacterium]